MTTQTDQIVAAYKQGREDEIRERQMGAPLFKTPDITPAQIVAVVGAVLAAAAAFGFDLDDKQTSAILQLVAVVAALLLGGDAVIRHGRATGNARKDGE